MEKETAHDALSPAYQDEVFHPLILDAAVNQRAVRPRACPKESRTP